MASTKAHTKLVAYSRSIFRRLYVFVQNHFRYMENEWDFNSQNLTVFCGVALISPAHCEMLLIHIHNCILNIKCVLIGLDAV